MSQLALTRHGGHQFKPVFQDLSLRRWYSFLAFVGSAAATAVFLSAILWYSVQTTPDLPVLDDQLPTIASVAPVQLELALAPFEPEQQGPSIASAPTTSSAPDTGLSLALQAIPSGPAAMEAAHKVGDAAAPRTPENMAFARGSFVVLGGIVDAGSVVHIGETGGRDRPEPAP